MKKNFLSRLSVCLLSALMLSACAGSFTTPDPAAHSAVKNSNKSLKKPKKRAAKATAQNGNSYNISLNDFSDLNLPNDGQTRGNIWEKLSEGFKIDNPESHPEVQQQIRWFLNHPGYLQRTTERARPYMYIVYNEVKKRGLPTELVLLPINESGYYPFSYSTTGATGIWQLMPGTASNFGLKHDFWYDGRRDIFDSTNAALDYLTYLANYFNNDWLLAIAAYDTGEGNVQNAIARNVREGLPTDFWSLKLSAETRAYVPRLLAIAAIIQHPDRYPVALPSIDDKPVVAPVRLPKQMKIADVARLSGLSVNQVKVLNPGLSRLATDPSLDAKVMLPIDSIEDFQQGLQTAAVTPIEPSVTRYVIKRGDTLPRIANRFGVSVEALLQSNNGLADHIAIGQEILVPNASESFKPNAQINLDQANLTIQSTPEPSPKPQATPVSTSDVEEAPVTSKTPNAKKAKVSSSNKTNVAAHKTLTAKASKSYKAKAGDTWASIAAKNHVTVSQLKQTNPNVAKKALKPGQVVLIPSA